MGPKRFARIRRLPANVVERARRRPKLTGVAAVAVLVAVAAAGMTLTSAKTNPAPLGAAGQPSFTYAGSWTLLELQSRIQAGEVVGVTTGDTANPNGDGTIQTLV